MSGRQAGSGRCSAGGSDAGRSRIGARTWLRQYQQGVYPGAVSSYADGPESSSEREGRDMARQQLDLFSTRASSPEPSSSNAISQPDKPPPASLEDAELVAQIAKADVVEAPVLAMEAGRRRLAGAISALEALCLRFAGFGLNRRIPEQEAALDALAMIGGPHARQSVAKMILKGVVQGPSLRAAVAAAAHLKIVLPCDTISELLQHDDGHLRAKACGCVPGDPKVMSCLMACLQDHEPEVRNSAACALGRLGRNEALAPLTHLLQQAPSADVIDAVTSVANEDCVILLGRIARTCPDLRSAAIEALEAIEHPTAALLVARFAGSSEQ